MKECAPVDMETPAAKFPIRTEQEVEAEYIVFERGEHATADETKISDIFFGFTAVSHAGIFAAADLQLDPAQVFLFAGAVSKTRVASAKDGPEDAVAGNFPVIATRTQTITMAMRTGGFG